MKNNEQKIEEDIKEFRERFCRNGVVDAAREPVEDFVRQLLKSRDSYWREKIKEGLREIEYACNFAIKQKAIRYPEYIKGINKGGENIKIKVLEIKKRLSG